MPNQTTRTARKSRRGMALLIRQGVLAVAGVHPVRMGVQGPPCATFHNGAGSSPACAQRQLLKPNAACSE